MMKWMAILLTLALLLGLNPGSTNAQDDQPECDVDLVRAIRDLVEAQRDADTGSLDASLITVESVRDSLNDLLEACLPSEAEPEEPVISADLPEQVVSPDGTFAFNIPEGWVSDRIDTSFIFAGTRAEEAEFFASNLDVAISPGARAVAVFYDGLENILGGDREGTLAEAVQEFRITIASNENVETASIPESVRINDRAAFSFTFESELYSAMVVMLDYSEQNRVAVIIVAGGPGEGEAVQSLTSAIAASFQSPVNTGGGAFDWEGELEILSVQPLAELLEDRPRVVALAPDGSSLAWVRSRGGERGICLYDFEVASSTCLSVSEEVEDELPASLIWSPDSRYVAFTQDFVNNFIDPDVWLLDTETMAIIQRTGQEDEPDTDMPDSTTIDFAPMWGPDNTLYFLRLSPIQTDSHSRLVDVYRVSAEGDEAPELVRSLGTEVTFMDLGLSEFYALNGMMAISPDGDSLAIATIRHFGEHVAGLWLVDLTSEDPPQQLFSIEAFVAAMPPFINNSRSDLLGLGWSDDGRTLFVVARNNGTSILALPYTVDTITGELTVLVDLSELTEAEFNEQRLDPSGYEGRTVAASIVPPGAEIALASMPFREVFVVNRLLRDADETVITLTQGDEQIRNVPTTHSSASADGKAIMHESLIRFINP